ncbi:MAG: hypothetical protein KY410_03615 [Proteobacteria bacterium]|nr:hypothetical protein [Pseudomonadota bacterium]
MVRHSWWSFLPGRAEARKRILLCGFACLLLGACAGGQETRPVFERWPASDSTSTGPYLLALREYLAQPPGKQATHRRQLRAAAARGQGPAQLEYALALSVDRDDRASLEEARDMLESMLAAPDPLPVALDALVRLQLGQTIDRLQRMQASGEIHRAYRAAASERKMCAANLEEQVSLNQRLRGELRETERKLDALARIERTVNETQPQRERGETFEEEDK